MEFCQVHGELSLMYYFFIVSIITPFRKASARQAECVRSCNRLVCSEHQMATGFRHRVVDVFFCPRRAMRERRATSNWSRVVKRLKRIRRWRKIWHFWESI